MMESTSRKRTQAQLSPRKGNAAKKARAMDSESDNGSFSDSEVELEAKISAPENPYLTLPAPRLEPVAVVHATTFDDESIKVPQIRTSIVFHRTSTGRHSRLVRVYPAPTTSFIQLRMQLCRFKGVYRQVRVPTNYTFANLHTLIQYLFGWGGGHLHQSKVWADVEMYSGNYKAYHIKDKGRIGPFPHYLDRSNPHHLAEHYYFNRHRKLAEYDVRSVGSRRRGYHNEDFGDQFKIIEDDKLTIGQVWNRQLAQNVCAGYCTNKSCAIEYEYDLGASWQVDITLDREDEFFSVETPSNLPMIVKVKGAPPVEDSHHDESMDAKDKMISPLLLKSQNFKLFCEGKFKTRAGMSELKCQYLGMDAEQIATIQQEIEVSEKGQGKSKWQRMPLPSNHAQLEQEIRRRTENRLAQMEELKNMYRRRQVSEDENESESGESGSENEGDGCVVM